MTPKSFDHDDLGIDLARTADLPECAACRKKSDAAQVICEGAKTTVLCGRHYDGWLTRRRSDPKVTADAFARDLRETVFRACWEAVVE